MPTSSLFVGDCVEVMARGAEGAVDAIVCDPPYGIGFMGKGWDDLPPGRPWAETCLRALKPGGHLLAFGGTRTFHRLTCALEDGGFEIRDCLMWLYGSGFPKSHNVALGIDKAAGKSDRGRAIPAASTHFPSGKYVEEKLTPNKVEAYEARTDASAPWVGWGTALKPAWEPIIMARKSLEGTVAKNVLAHGTGALNIDATRVGTTKDVPASPRRAEQGPAYGDLSNDPGTGSGFDASVGRWPANLMLSHAEGCECVGTTRVKGAPHLGQKNPGEERQYGGGTFGGGRVKDGYANADGMETVEAWVCVEDCPVRLLDEQSGETKSPRTYKRTADARNVNSYGFGIGEPAGTESLNYGDQGGASRFFYCTKASRKERNAGLDEFEAKFAPTMGDGIGGKEHNPETATKKKNTHPTVKPIDLMRYLCRLVTPPGGLVVDPFVGSGSTGIAAELEGFRFVGIDRDADYIEIARARIAHVGAEVEVYR